MPTPIYQNAQDAKFINSIRETASEFLDLADKVLGYQKEWNNCFGAESRLTEEAFVNQNAGMVKQKISDALSVLSALNTWLDTDSNRMYLEDVRSSSNFPIR